MSDHDDPFAAFNADRTVIKPTAGRAAAAVPAGVRDDAPPQAATAKDAPLAMDALMAPSLNPLVAVAAPLLIAAPRLRTTARHPNPAGLKDALADGLRKFEAEARRQGLPNEQVIAARYILCTLLDEAAASTPWGGAGVWSAQSLLVQFHNETWGGEKVFHLLSKLAENVDANRYLLELLYVAMAFGFEGRYRVIDNGRAQLDSVRERLAQMLKTSRGAYEPTLSPRWQGIATAGQRLRDGVPLWVVGALAALLVAAVFMALRLSLANAAGPVFESLRSIDTRAAPVAVAAPVVPVAPATPPVPRLATFLKPEVDAGLVRVQDEPDRSIVTIKGDGFFEPGSATVAPAVRSLLPRIAQALADTPGSVLVTGHTDNQPIRSLRFPSNWHLSQERAEAVRDELARTVKPERLRAEGKAESEPVADNATPAGRALNRRVVVTLFVPPHP